jgi:hypothetical protein
MPTGNYPIAVVIVNRHEPEHEVATRLLELADEKGYEQRNVEAARGDHDAALSFRVPQDVADAFNEDRADRWPSDKIENDEEKAADLAAAGVNGDAYATDSIRNAQAERASNAANADDKTTTSGRPARPGKAKE